MMRRGFDGVDGGGGGNRLPALVDFHRKWVRSTSLARRDYVDIVHLSLATSSARKCGIGADMGEKKEHRGDRLKGGREKEGHRAEYNQSESLQNSSRFARARLELARPTRSLARRLPRCLGSWLTAQPASLSACLLRDVIHQMVHQSAISQAESHHADLSVSNERQPANQPFSQSVRRGEWNEYVRALTRWVFSKSRSPDIFLSLTHPLRHQSFTASYSVTSKLVAAGAEATSSPSTREPR